MNISDAAAELDGSEYREEGSREFFAAMKEAGLVAVFGASDDLMEFRGAITDEVGCYGGGTAFLTSNGLVENECDNYYCPYFERAQSAASAIHAAWSESEAPWTYKTDIPHVKFNVLADGDPYCEGIVFALKDVP